MRKTIAFLLLTSISLPAFAEQEEAAVSPSPTAAIPKLATLVEPDEQVAVGDLISITRRFDQWSLLCDYRLSQNKRLCSIEQGLSDGKSSVLWRIANSVDNRALLILSVDPKMVVSKGLRLGFSDLEKTIPEKEWLCNPSACITGFVFDGFLQAAIANSPAIRFSFTKMQDSTEIPIDLLGSMSGFDLALKSGSTDPFGRLEVSKAAASAAEAPKEQKPAEKKIDKKAEAPVPPVTEKLAEAKPQKAVEAKPQRVADNRPKRRHVQERPQPHRNQLY